MFDCTFAQNLINFHYIVSAVDFTSLIHLSLQFYLIQTPFLDNTAITLILSNIAYISVVS